MPVSDAPEPSEHRFIAPIVGPDDERRFTDSGIEIDGHYDEGDVAPRLEDQDAARPAPRVVGHLDVGESYSDCAVREVREELGVEIAATQRTAGIPATEQTGWEFVELHTAEHNGPMNCAPDEIETGGWFRPADVTGWVRARPQDFASGFIECWRAWLACRPGDHQTAEEALPDQS